MILQAGFWVGGRVPASGFQGFRVLGLWSRVEGLVFRVLWSRKVSA